MSRYTLITYHNYNVLEKFANRNSEKIKGILQYQSTHVGPAETPFGEPLTYVNRIELLDNHREKIFNGSLDEALTFSNTLV
jgi:molybdopterin-guanine dinucleotide biosynthesis protein A